MNKLLTKIVGAVASLALVFGVGFGLTNSNSQAKEVKADAAVDSTQTLVINRTSFGSGSGYSIADFAKSTTGGTTVFGLGQIYLNTDASMQFNKGQGVGAVWNITPIPGVITSISAKTASGTNRAWNAWVSSTAYSYVDSTFTPGSNATKLNASPVTVTTSQTTIGSSDHGYSYFAVIENVNSASYLENITITYTSSGETSQTGYSVIYDANGGTGTITDSNSPYSSGATVTVKNATGFTAPSGKEFSH